jgi:hypothetical protein
MSRSLRLLLVFIVLIGVVIMMMDCAKKSMQLKKKHAQGVGAPHSAVIAKLPLG